MGSDEPHRSLAIVPISEKEGGRGEHLCSEVCFAGTTGLSRLKNTEKAIGSSLGTAFLVAKLSSIDRWFVSSPEIPLFCE